MARIIKIDNPDLNIVGQRIIVFGGRGIIIPCNAEVLDDGQIPLIQLSGIKYKYCSYCKKWVAYCYFASCKRKRKGKKVARKVAYCSDCYRIYHEKRYRLKACGKFI